MSKRKYTTGTDPEFFLKAGDKYVSAIPHIKGSKHEPAALPNGGTIQRDNVAVEFATAPTAGGKDFVESVRKCLKDTLAQIPEGCEIVVEPSATFDDDQLDHPEAQEFGCEPDYNAWTLEENEKPWCGVSGFRSCGAHIHVGGLTKAGKPRKGLEFLSEFQGRIRMVKAMDLLHGVISTVLDNSEASVERRKLYGKAGAHRPTPYGVEYRVLSNYWMKSPELVMLMDSLTGEAVKLVTSGKLDELIKLIGENDLQNIINEGRVEDAQKIIDQDLRPILSGETLDYLDMALEKVGKYQALCAEWKI